MDIYINKWPASITYMLGYFYELVHKLDLLLYTTRTKIMHKANNKQFKGALSQAVSVYSSQ